MAIKFNIRPEYFEGQIITSEVQGIHYIQPPIPEFSKIRGIDLPIEDQVWCRREEDGQWENWNTDPNKGPMWSLNASDEQLQWFDEEIERLMTGEWVMINGVPTYFNKYCYFFFQWFRLLNQKYPVYKDVCLEYFIFFMLCEEDPLCLGDLGIKGRRVGLSSMSAAIKVLIGILESNTLSGIVSKTGTDAQEMFFMVKNGIEGLPEFLMPDLNKVTESEVHIAKTSKKISANNTRINSDKGKNNRVNYLDTSETAYDGRGMRHITVDEAAKWVKANVKTLLAKISDTLVQGAMIIGKLSLFSTVDRGDKGGDNFREIWEGSDHINGKKDVYGRTKTKLKRFFLPAYRGYMGYIGKYGESIIENPTPLQIVWLQTHEFINPITGKKDKCPDPFVGARQFMQVTRDMLSDDPEALADEKRKNPFEWKEVFQGANNRCNFDLEALKQQIERVETRLEEQGRSVVTGENGRRGVMKKRDNGEKYFEDNKQGMIYILQFPDAEYTNKVVHKNSIKCPDNTAYGAAGLDTFANAKATVDKGSDACLMVHRRYNALDPDNSNMPVAMFLGRPKTKGEFHDQIFWLLEFYGIKMLAERSPTDWEDYAVDKERRLASPLDHVKKYGYLMSTKRSNKTDVYGVAPQDKEAREQHLTEMIEYALNNVHKIWFLRLLKDMVDFDIEERTDYDACMAWGYALMALKEHVNKPVEPEREESIVRTFNLYSRRSA